MQVTMPWLTDASCKQKFPQVDTINAVCAGTLFRQVRRVFKRKIFKNYFIYRRRRWNERHMSSKKIVFYLR